MPPYQRSRPVRSALEYRLGLLPRDLRSPPRSHPSPPPPSRKPSRFFPADVSAAIVRKRRELRTVLTWIAVASVGAIGAAATWDALRSPDPRSSARASAPRTTASEPAPTDRITLSPPTGTTTSESGACANAEECREEWSRAVAEDADFKIAEYTGSAWVAEGHGRSFYIWATEATPTRPFAYEGYRILRRIGGVRIFTDNVRLAWRAQGATVWIEAGPTEESVAPKPSELRRLVRASKTIAIG
jgi:hypothetical protein